MPRSPLFRRGPRSVVLRRDQSRVPFGRGRPMVSRYGPTDSRRPAVARPADAEAEFDPEFDPEQTPPTEPLPGPPPTAPTAPVESLSMRMLALAALPTPPTGPLDAVDEADASHSASLARTATRTAVTSVHRAYERRTSHRRRAAFRRASTRRQAVPRRARDRRRGRRPAAPLLAGLVVGILVAALGLPSRTSIGPPAATAALVATPGALTGLALGDDRLPDCAPVVERLTSRQKLAQRIMVGVLGNDPAATAQMVHETQVGGIFVGGDAPQLLTGQALRGVQAASRLPLTVAVDDEGGRVQRVEALDGNLPSARTLARTRDSTAVQVMARDRGKQLAARGVTMNMAPDVDVSDQPAAAVIGDRSFADDAATVAGFAAAYARGEQEAGVFTVLKHFPGHGHADGDSHRGRVTTPPIDQLTAADLTPYAELLAPGGPLADPTRTGVMVGHLDVPGLTDQLPASLTPATYHLLRSSYQFDGLVITDDLGAMKAVTEELPLVDAVERALAAGADVALWTSGDPAPPVLDALERDLASGGLDAKADDTAVERVLAAKGICSRR